jgi:hypothetical protein
MGVYVQSMHNTFNHKVVRVRREVVIHASGEERKGKECVVEVVCWRVL